MSGTSRTLTLKDADITLGSTIKPTSAGALTVQSKGANDLTLGTGGAGAVNIGTANATTLVLGNTANTTLITLNSETALAANKSLVRGQATVRDSGASGITITAGSTGPNAKWMAKLDI